VAHLGKPVALPRPVTAVIDTGAQSTVLKPEHYHVNLYFADDFVVENIFAVEAPMGGVRYDCLIGRDVLRLAVLVYDGRSNKFTLTF